MRKRGTELHMFYAKLALVLLLCVPVVLLGAFLFSRLIYFVTAVISAVLIYIARIVWKRILRLHLLNNENLPHMLIVASRETAEACIRSIRKRRYNDFFISGVVIVKARIVPSRRVPWAAFKNPGNFG